MNDSGFRVQYYIRLVRNRGSRPGVRGSG